MGETMRILLAGLLGAIAMYIWTAVAHMATPLADVGFSQLGNEPSVLQALNQGGCPKAGLYFFPWVDPKNPKAMEKSAELMKTNTAGLMICQPAGSVFNMTPMLIREFFKELAQCLIAAFLLSFAVAMSYVARVGFVTLVGVFAALGTDTSYWIWYGYPLNYTLANITMGLVGAIVAGLVIAAIVKPRLQVRIPLGG
jgi:hypothetical protein